MSQKYEKDSLGTRMKGYESVPKLFLTQRTPVIARIDGRAFHTYVKRLKDLDPTLKDTPFSELMHDVMMFTTSTLVQQVQGCVFGYTQSDEISLLIRDWDTLDTQPWFGNSIQKMTSLMGAIASNAFNFSFSDHYIPMNVNDLAQFDARVFNIPKEEVANYFIWRQQDASRNSIQMLGRFHFSQKQMHGKNNSQVQDMLMLEKGVNWNDIPTWMKRGACIMENRDCASSGRIVLDNEIPIFTQDRAYIEQHLTSPEKDPA